MRMLHDSTRVRSHLPSDTARRTLVTELRVHTELRGPFLLVKELVAGLAQEHETAGCQVGIVGLVLVVDMQVLDPLVLLATEVARAVVGGEHPFAEHLPLRSLSELLVLVRLLLEKFFVVHT